MRSAKILNIKGSMLIELSIALAICSIVFTAFATVLFTRQAFANDAKLRSEAIFLARDNLTQATSSFYITPCLKKNTGMAAWDSVFLKNDIVFSLLLPDLEVVRSIAGDCGGTYPLSKLSASSTFTTISYPLVGTSTALDIFQLKAYITQNIVGTSTLSIFLLAQPTGSPELVSSLELSHPIVMLDAIPNTIYLAANSSSNQFQIVDITNEAHPTLQGTYTLPGVAGSFPGALSILYYNNKIYIGTHRTAGRELHVYDVSRTPALWLGSLEVNHNINALAVREPYLYLATSGNTKDLIIVDIKNPAAMSITSSLDIPGNEDVLSMYMKGQTIYAGRKKSLSAQNPDFISIDVTDPLKPTIATSSVFKKDIAGIRAIGTSTFLILQDRTTSLTTPNNTKLFNDVYIDSDFEGNSFFTLTEKALHITTMDP